jgi:sugar lactone lactonase YvrE
MLEVLEQIAYVFNYLFQEVVMEFSSLFRIVRRLPIVLLLALLIAGLLMAGCGSGGGISSITSTTGNLSNSRGLAVDSSRNVFIADAGHHVIREANRSTGLLTSIVGTLSSNGYSGDGGPATSAKLNFPQGVALDSAGNLFIADTGNNVIREIAATTQVISTIAGTGIAGFAGDNGGATVATLNAPLAVALDSSGTLLYIADTGNNVIRKVVLSTGVITTVAGTGAQCHIPNPPTATTCGDGGLATSANLNNPQSVALDSSGNLYIADTANFVIREVSGGNISTVAGSYVAGGGCQTTTSCNNAGPATSAQLNNPQGVAVDSSGNIYIADTGNNIIRKVAGGNISTVVGNGTAGFTEGSATRAELLSPNALAFDSTGTLYIDDAGNQAVRKIGF